MGAHLRLESGGPVPNAPAFELAQTRDCGPAITRAAGDDDRPRPEPPLIGELQRQLAVGPRLAAVQRGSLCRNQNLGAEFLRLDEGTTGKRLARYTGGEAQVVFDTRAGTGLSAERATVQNDNVQAFRSRIHGSREPGGASAHHGNVEELILLGRIKHSEAASKRGCRGG